MEVNDAMINKLAALARLRFTMEEKEKIKSDLQKMIGFIKKMDELDTAGTTPLLHITAQVNILREDVVQGSISNAEALENAARSSTPYFIVPKVIKKTAG